MKKERREFGWRPLVGVLGVVALALGLSLKLEGAPAPVQTGSSESKATRVENRAATSTKVDSFSANQAASAAPASSSSRIKAGSIPANGLQVLSVTHVDWRDDEGTRRRNAGTLVGPMPSPTAQGGVAGFGQLAPLCPSGFCSFNIDCDDGLPCTFDRCDIVAGTGTCTGKCVADPVRNNDAGDCDNGIFCDGSETCQGSVCTVATTVPARLGQPCDSHSYCGIQGTCNLGTGFCSSGNTPETECTTHDDCDIRGTCSIGGAPCDSDAGCAPSNGTCTIAGTCAGGACEDGIPAICCPDHEDPTKRTVCSERSARCVEGPKDGEVCNTSADCPEGTCERCQPSCTNDASCADGNLCNGVERCELTCVGGSNPGVICTLPAGSECLGGGTCLGQCEPGVNPCGAGARCTPKDCGGVSPPFTPCESDVDCAEQLPPDNVCLPLATPQCFLGRCCEEETPGNASDELTCNKKRILQCNTGGDLFYASDTGEHSPLTTEPNSLCGGQDTRLGINAVAWNCPKYSYGISQLNANNPPIYPVLAGPVSASQQPIPAPNGPGTVLNQLGDDYKLFNESRCVGGSNNGMVCVNDAFCAVGAPPGRCGSFMALTVLRYVGYAESGGTRASIDFYDAAGNFVEDVITDTMSSSLGINVVIFTPPLTIAPSGWMVIRVAQDFVTDMRFRWASTTAAAPLGGNDPDAIWVNSYPGPAESVDNNYFFACNAGPHVNEACVGPADCPNGACVEAPAILAFELVGDKVADPAGACCKSSEGTCQDGVVSWVCSAQRSCSNNPGMSCATDNDCSPGFCLSNVYHGDNTLCKRCNGGPNLGQTCPTPGVDPGNCPSGGSGTCSTGLVGNACTIGNDAGCNELGVCDLATQICVNAHAPGCGTNCGQPSCCTKACTVDSDCNIAGTCVAVECTAIAACGSGACCDVGSGACSIAMNPGACGGSWQGYGTDCDADNGYDAAQQHCCTIPNYSGLRCMGGTQNNQACVSNGADSNDDGIGDADCRFCVGGSHHGEACTTTSAAEPNGCLNEGTCVADVCVGGSTPGAACEEDEDCPDDSGVCRGRCMSRGTGGDSCEDAVVQVITVPTLAEGPKTVTLSGSNLDATSTEEEPDSFWGAATTTADEPGWWEAFSIDECARVRLDFCCSDPIAQPQWAFLVRQGNDGCTDGITIPDSPDINTPGQPDFRRGGPYCPDDNLWHTFGPLEAGTYYYPKYAVLRGSHGPYQVHITVQSCVSAACCYLECSSTPQPCGPDSPCPGIETCDTKCDQMVKDDCDAKLGYYLGPPNVSPAQAQCFGSTCDTGSCCTGPGQCKDARQNFGNPMTRVVCEGIGFEGDYIGGVKCKGGTCGCGTDVGLSCNVAADCSGPAICPGPGYTGPICSGTPAQLAQLNPCPVCVIEGSTNCQRYETLVSQASPSDRSTGSGIKMADDFKLIGPGTLESVCVTGAYVLTDPDVATEDCGGTESPPESQDPDFFQVRVYFDENGRPGALKGESTCTRSKAVKPGATFLGGARMWTYQLSLNTPIGFTAGEATQCFWLEVTNDTGTDPAYCTWHWAQLAEDSTVANQYSAAGSVVSGYGIGSTRPWDFVWCTNLDLTEGGCASEAQPCCNCDGGCTELTLNDCDDAFNVWHDKDPNLPNNGESCGDVACVPPANDACPNAELVPVGLYPLTTYCATPDNAFSVELVDVQASSPLVTDVWFNFRPTEDCPLRVDSCTSGQQFGDTVVAIYHDSSNPSQCPCPQSQADVEIGGLLVSSGDDNCTEYFESGGVAEVNALVGHCYTIQFAGFAPFTNGAARAAMDISCGPPVCGDGRRNGSEECDGSDNDLCRTADPSTLCKPAGGPGECTCGAPNPCDDGDLDPGEECDSGVPGVACPSPSVCRPKGDPKQCTCPKVCGNGNVEAGEECDGNSPLVGHPCPGRCRSTESPPVCLCPPLACGNGRLEDLAGEDCEFGLCSPLTGLRKCSDPPYATCTMDNDPLCGAGECLKANECSSNSQCGAGTCDLTADRGDCDSGGCRTANDPLGGCRCGCESAAVINNIVWKPATIPGPWPNSNHEAATRALRFYVEAAEPGGPSKVEAIKVTMVDLQTPNPPNNPLFPPPNFHAWDIGSPANCASCTGEICPANATAQGGCARWVGRPSTFYETQGPPLSGPYRASRLQCTPFYWDWKSEELGGRVTVVGAEVVPSSQYSVQAYSSTCLGIEGSCTDVSAPVTMYTRRSGDVDAEYNPPSATNQPNAIDVAQLVNKFKNAAGSPDHFRAQIQANLPELNASINALDIVAVVDGTKSFAYSFSGPCACPSTVTCGGTCVGCVGICVKKCVGGDNAGEPCINNNHCPGGGSCPANGTCHDRCGRCTP